MTEKTTCNSKGEALRTYMNMANDLVLMAAKAGTAALLGLSLTACSAPAEVSANVEAKYDEKTGKLSALTMNAEKDGKPNVFSYMDGSRFVRIEIDNDENGSIDRWEYYGADQKLQKVGLSRANDGIVDSWLFQGPDGLPAKMEVSTRRDGRVNRTEFYSKGDLARAEEDTDADGNLDKWETYEGGSLAVVSFDMTKSGKPTVTIDYRKERR